MASWMLCSRASLVLALRCFVVAKPAAHAKCEEDAAGQCAASTQADQKIVASASQTPAGKFWSEMRQRGLQVKLKERTVEEKVPGKRTRQNRTAMVLSDDVFYGRAIIKIPRQALLSIETAPNLKLRRELNKFLFEDNSLERTYNITGEEATHLLSLAYPLIAEKRNPQSVFRDWLDAAHDVRLPVLEFTKRQRHVLRGTTVEAAYEEMVKNRNLIEQTAGNLTFFSRHAVSRGECAWALAVIMRHAQVVHPHQDVRGHRDARMYIFPLTKLLKVQLHPDPGVSITFQEEITVDAKREEEMVLQIARRDMPKGEEVFFWPGHFSNSEMVVRHGIMFPKNPVGIGRNTSVPSNWNDNKNSNIRQEYGKYNCTSVESFELHISPRGYPDRLFVRCYRVSWFITNGWYSPGYVSRFRELSKWPPPKKYSKDDWLAWTQADAELNRYILEYCRFMRQQLKDTMDAATAKDFRSSTDPVDNLVWQLRAEETRTFKECLTLAKSLL